MGPISSPSRRFIFAITRSEKGYWLYGSREPVSIVVCDAHGVRALNIQAHELSLTELIRDVPGLEAVLEEFTSVGD